MRVLFLLKIRNQMNPKHQLNQLKVNRKINFEFCFFDRIYLVQPVDQQKKKIYQNHHHLNHSNIEMNKYFNQSSLTQKENLANMCVCCSTFFLYQYNKTFLFFFCASIYPSIFFFLSVFLLLLSFFIIIMAAKQQIKQR